MRRISPTTIVIIAIFIAGLVAGIVIGNLIPPRTIIITHLPERKIVIPGNQTCYCNNNTRQCICILNNSTNITLARWKT